MQLLLENLCKIHRFETDWWPRANETWVLHRLWLCHNSLWEATKKISSPRLQLPAGIARRACPVLLGSLLLKQSSGGKKKTSSVENINCLFLSIDTVHDCISRSFLGWSCDSSTQKNVSNSNAGIGCQTLPVKYIVFFLLIPSGCWCPKLPWKLHPLWQMLHQRGAWTTVQRGSKTTLPADPEPH